MNLKQDLLNLQEILDGGMETEDSLVLLFKGIRISITGRKVDAFHTELGHFFTDILPGESTTDVIMSLVDDLIMELTILNN